MAFKETAWSSWDEWGFVKNLFASGCYEKQLEAMKMVNMWKSRVRGGALPISVELTTTLFASKHKLQQTNHHEACLCAAMAIVRFINGITDQFQTGIYAQAIQNIAEKIEIPDWLVDIRHEATHGQLPSFEVLQSGLNFGIDWLFKNYWEETSLKIEEETNRFYSNVYDKINSYSILVFDNMSNIIIEKNSAEMKKEKKKSNKNDYDRESMVNGLLKVLNQNNFKFIVSILTCSDRFLIHNNRVNENDFLTQLFEECEQKSILMRCFASSWKLLLEALQNKFPQFIEFLVESLVAKCNESAGHFKSQSLLIAMYACVLASGTSKTALMNSLSYLLNRPSNQCFHILKMLCEDGILEGNFKTNMMELITTFELIFPGLQNSESIDWRKFLASDETCNLFKDTIDRFQTFSDKGLDKLTSDTSKKWRRVNEQELTTLPPLGDFDYRAHISRVRSHSQIIKMIDTDFDDTVCFQVNNNYNQLGNVIDDLFNDIDYVNLTNNDEAGGGDDSDSCPTEGYNEDADMPWFDEDDVNSEVQDKQKVDCESIAETKEKKFDGQDYANKISLDASTIDVSKIMLF